MAENIYSRGTRVWFEDKDQAWLSAEVTSVTKGLDDTIKLVFIDERGKVHSHRLFWRVRNNIILGNNNQHDRQRDKGREREPASSEKPTFVGDRR